MHDRLIVPEVEFWFLNEHKQTIISTASAGNIDCVTVKNVES